MLGRVADQLLYRFYTTLVSLDSLTGSEHSVRKD
jgi:hypothetical protein